MCSSETLAPNSLVLDDSFVKLYIFLFLGSIIHEKLRILSGVSNVYILNKNVKFTGEVSLQKKQRRAEN